MKQEMVLCADLVIPPNLGDDRYSWRGSQARLASFEI